MTELFKISNGQLSRISTSFLDRESEIEKWVVRDLSLVGINGIIIGQQVQTDHGGRVDILALDEAGSLVIIELKRDRTPRDIVAQVLDYASWVSDLTTRDVHELTVKYRDRSLNELYRDHFDKALPETLNATHQMMIVAGSFDEASQRIVEYLSDYHQVGINVSFFQIFDDAGQEFLATDTLLEQSEVTERSTRKAKAPWSGYWYTTTGSEDWVAWEDLREYGFIIASGGRWYTDGLRRLSVGDPIFLYQKGTGYVGFGIINSNVLTPAEFQLPDGRKLVEAIPRNYFSEYAEDPEKRAYVIGVEWISTVDRSHAKWFQGAFANQNIACRLSHQETVEFLLKEFEVPEEFRP